MARNDGVDRVTARNVNLADTKIANVQRHNEMHTMSFLRSASQTVLFQAFALAQGLLMTRLLKSTINI